MPAPNAPHTLTSLTRDYDAQLHRTEKLVVIFPAAKEILGFYRRVLSFQKTFHLQIAQSTNSQSAAARKGHPFVPLRDAFDLTLLLPHFRPFLSLIEQHAPKPLATAAHELAALPAQDWIAFLTSYWQAGGLPENDPAESERVSPAHAEPRSASMPTPGQPSPNHHVPITSHESPVTNHPITQFFARAFLQPYAALRASESAVPPSTSTPSICPLCGASPLLGILRPEGDGGKRSLLCSFCGTEWSYRRILCANCGETDEPKLPVFIADQFPHIRTEACDTCRTYLRTIDLTKDGHAVPVVDDLAALPLSLWAHEHAYTRLHPNLLST
jgi:formate dehydrogenase maturation protein FdhE